VSGRRREAPVSFLPHTAGYPLVLPRRLAFQRVHQRLVAAEQMLHPVAVARERLSPIELVHRPVECRMRAPQVGRHGVGIVQVGEATRRPRRPRVEGGLGELLDRVASRWVEVESGHGKVL